MKTPTIPPELASELWPHQKRAVQFALRYLRKPFKARTGLVRMPTGTGKTGVIAVLSAGMPPSNWTLVLTPWANLCKQMIDDIQEEFWKDRWTPPKEVTIQRLYPSKLADVLNSKDDQLILVATFSTLVTIFKNQRDEYDRLALKLSQVIVDEGHYEPAVEWGQAVKKLESQTLLLTATPYRNDLKLFRVKKKDVYHYTHRDAELDGIIRKVDFRPIGVTEPTYDQLEEWCRAFVRFWKTREKFDFHVEPRAIICCATRETVKRVTQLLRDRNINALGIHDRFGAEKKDWLRTETPKPESVKYNVWVHQNKLTEGLDDHRFCILAVLNRIRNDRKLIQQIGRILRRTPKRSGQGQALVLYSDDLMVERTWQNYREFELQPNIVDPERYRLILKKVLAQQPDLEYFGRHFRRRFEPGSSELESHILLRASAVVRRVRDSFKLADLTEFASDFLLLEDLILLGPRDEPLIGPDDSRLWVYAIFGNSPLLIEHSQYEIRLGAMAAVKHNNLLFVVDTEGVYPVKYLGEHTKKLAPSELGRIFGARTIPKEVSLTNPWPAGPMVRRSTVFADDLNATPAQLTDASYFCASVRATVKAEKRGLPSRRHYVGFQRGRIAEEIQSARRSAFSLSEFVNWSKSLAALIETETRRPPLFFKRYLSQVPAPQVVTPRYVVINLFDSDLELKEDGSDEYVELVDSIAELQGATTSNGTGGYPFSIQYRTEADVAKKTLEGTLIYDDGTERFRIRSEEMNSSILVAGNKDEPEGLTNYLNNNDEEFTVALDDAETYYTADAFYKVDYTHAEGRLTRLLKTIDDLGTVTSEKGKKTKATTSWSKTSIFGLLDNYKPSGFIQQNFGKLELLLCDDMGTEVADFICADFTGHRIAFLHAKHGKDRIVSASALHDVVAQALKNLGVISRGGSLPKHLDRWNRTSMWSGTKVRRWRYGLDTLPTGENLWNEIRDRILDHPESQKEVWLVLGKTLEKTELVSQLKIPSQRTAVTGQIVHLLSGLQAVCTQLAVRLRVFCH
jgi:superfamily II DNA or RNA helicase